MPPLFAHTENSTEIAVSRRDEQGAHYKRPTTTNGGGAVRTRFGSFPAREPPPTPRPPQDVPTPSASAKTSKKSLCNKQGKHIAPPNGNATCTHDTPLAALCPCSLVNNPQQRRGILFLKIRYFAVYHPLLVEGVLATLMSLPCARRAEVAAPNGFRCTGEDSGGGRTRHDQFYLIHKKKSSTSLLQTTKQKKHAQHT